MSKLVKRFKSQVSWSISVNVMRGDQGFYCTIQKSRKSKETNEYEDTPFMSPTDLAGIISAANQALAFIDANTLPREKGATAPAKESPLPQSLQDEEIPF